MTAESTPTPPIPQPLTRPAPVGTPATGSSLTPTRVPWAAVAVFVVLAFGLAWLAALPLWLGDGLASPLVGVLLPLMMFTPAIAAVIVMVVFRVPRSGRPRFLGLWPLRPTGRFLLFLALGLVVPIVVVAAVVAIAGVTGLVTLDLVGFSGFAAQLAAVTPEGIQLPPVAVLALLQIAAIPVGAIVNSVFAFGEELGWRGWLQSALAPLGTWPMLVLTGILWGLWHAPVILLGYNFGRPDLVGLALMVAGCVAWGMLLGWLRLRSASLWPAVLAHGSLNAVGGLVLILVAAGAPLDLAVVGPLGILAWAVLAVVTVVIVLIGQFRPAAPAHPVPAGPTTTGPATTPVIEGGVR